MQDFAAIDFETANNERSSVCSVGVVIVKGGEIVDKFYSLIKPEPEYYNLDMIISVGYRVKSRKATTFPRCPDIDDCRVPYGRERCNGESSGQSNQ